LSRKRQKPLNACHKRADVLGGGIGEKSREEETKVAEGEETGSGEWWSL
jgi:hypothetical protein